MKTLCITGANGFIGSHVAIQAAQKRYSLRLLLRSEPQPAIRDLGARIFRGDVRNDADLAPFLEGADALLHVAGVNTPSSTQRDNIFTSNVEGTKQILRAAKKAGVQRIVHTGSVVALGCAGRGKTSNEETPFNLWNASTDYERSKYLGEKSALDLFAQEGLPVLVVHPAAARAAEGGGAAGVDDAPDAGFLRGAEDLFRALDVAGEDVLALAGGGRVHAGDVQQGVRAGEEGGQIGVVADVAAEDLRAEAAHGGLGFAAQEEAKLISLLGGLDGDMGADEPIGAGDAQRFHGLNMARE